MIISASLIDAALARMLRHYAFRHSLIRRISHGRHSHMPPAGRSLLTHNYYEVAASVLLISFRLRDAMTLILYGFAMACTPHAPSSSSVPAEAPITPHLRRAESAVLRRQRHDATSILLYI